ncbi:hypothetical protein [Microcoleus sp. B7-D4]|uniref:hypothetical protein n=1 Tax=Microcoleus sp. B7-D4 TaxID=2818696 RepID=UPI002FD1CBDF
MSISKFQQLVDINEEDHRKTIEYVTKNYDFIKEFTKKLALYIRAKELRLINSAEEIGFVDNNIEDFITIKNGCFFEFQLLLNISNPSNTNLYGQSFCENHLVPLSGVIFVIAVKQKENSFIVRVPAIEKEEFVNKEFEIKDQNDNNSLIEIFDSCFEAIKKTVECGLEKRISKLDISTDDTSKKIIGFYKPSEQSNFIGAYSH